MSTLYRVPKMLAQVIRTKCFCFFFCSLCNNIPIPNVASLRFSLTPGVFVAFGKNGTGTSNSKSKWKSMEDATIFASSSTTFSTTNC